MDPARGLLVGMAIWLHIDFETARNRLVVAQASHAWQNEHGRACQRGGVEGF